MEKSKLELTITSLVISHFSYCPLVWMFHDRKSYNKRNKIHERALRIIHKDRTSNFEGLLIRGNSVSVHQRNFQLLLIEIYKTINNLNPPFMEKYLLCRIIFVAALILFYPKLGQTCTALLLSGLLSNIMTDSTERNARVPNIRNFQKKIKAIPLDLSFFSIVGFK